uniref:Uncharacterized protein n=1 Tax=Anguilla anguilla TaxID=7936 RepID=A0A0E9XJ44_ANGAN
MSSLFGIGCAVGSFSKMNMDSQSKKLISALRSENAAFMHQIQLGNDKSHKTVH